MKMETKEIEAMKWCEICRRKDGAVKVIDTESEVHDVCNWCAWIFEVRLEQPGTYSRSVRKEVEV